MLRNGLPDNQGVPREIKFSAIAIDSKDQSATSNEITATLGNDISAPIVNFVSPELSITEAGLELAPVVELDGVAHHAHTRLHLHRRRVYFHHTFANFIILSRILSRFCEKYEK